MVEQRHKPKDGSVYKHEDSLPNRKEGTSLEQRSDKGSNELKCNTNGTADQGGSPQPGRVRIVLSRFVCHVNMVHPVMYHLLSIDRPLVVGGVVIAFDQPASVVHERLSPGVAHRHIVGRLVWFYQK